MNMLKIIHLSNLPRHDHRFHRHNNNHHHYKDHHHYWVLASFSRFRRAVSAAPEKFLGPLARARSALETFGSDSLTSVCAVMYLCGGR